MNDNTSSDFTRFAGCGLALAAIIAALALLIFALAYAGYIGTPGAGWGMGMMRNSGVMPMQNMSGTMPMQGMPGNMPMQGMPGAGMMTAATGAAAATSAAASAPRAQSGTAGAAAAASGTAYPGRAGTPGTAGGGTTGGAPATQTSEAAAGAGDALVIEDWRGYADDEALVDAFSFNTGVPDNDLELSIEPSLIPGGPVSATAAYSISVPAPNDYVGFDRSLGTAQDWSGFTHLAVRAEPSERSQRQLVLQWNEASGEVWRHRTRFEDIPADGLLLVPLTADAWEWADWSDNRNQQLDLDAVVNFGIFMGHAGPGRGTVELGTIEVVREP